MSFVHERHDLMGCKINKQVEHRQERVYATDRRAPFYAQTTDSILQYTYYKLMNIIADDPSK